MLTHPTLEELKSLGLAGMAEALAEQLDDNAVQEMRFEDRLALLVDRERRHRATRRYRNRLRQAQLRLNGRIEDVDYSAGRGPGRARRQHRGIEKITCSYCVLFLSPIYGVAMVTKRRPSREPITSAVASCGRLGLRSRRSFAAAQAA